MPPVAVGILYFVYAMLNGVTLSTVFAVYQLNSVISLFIVSALLFGVLGLIGYKTNKDLSSWSPYITVFLLAGVILSLINLFFIKSSTFDLILDWLILALFFGVTIYDINKIKLLHNKTQILIKKKYIFIVQCNYI